MASIEDLTIGIEEEYQIIDPESRELTSFISEFLEKGALLFRDQMKPEFLQSQVEISSKVCKNIQEAREEIQKLRRMISDFAEKNNRRILAAGTHPFSLWEDQIITDKERYMGLLDKMQYVARRLLIFGMHVHIGIEDRDLQIDIMNQMSYFMPHILTLPYPHLPHFGRDKIPALNPTEVLCLRTFPALEYRNDLVPQQNMTSMYIH